MYAENFLLYASCKLGLRLLTMPRRWAICKESDTLSRKIVKLQWNRAKRKLYSEEHYRKKRSILIGRESGRSNLRAPIKYFEAVNKFFLSTKMRAKVFNKSNFQGRKIKRKATRGKYRNLSLLYWRVDNWLSRCSRMAESWETEWMEVLQEQEKVDRSFENWPVLMLFGRYILFNLVRQPVGSMTYVPTIAAARKIATSSKKDILSAFQQSNIVYQHVRALHYSNNKFSH